MSLAFLVQLDLAPLAMFIGVGSVGLEIMEEIMEKRTSSALMNLIPTLSSPCRSYTDNLVSMSFPESDSKAPSFTVGMAGWTHS